MSDHLPECWQSDRHARFPYCICERLRACEQRALVQYNDGAWIRGMERGYASALYAARDAVARCEADTLAPATTILYAEAIAAIDALKEKP